MGAGTCSTLMVRPHHDAPSRPFGLRFHRATNGGDVGVIGRLLRAAGRSAEQDRSGHLGTPLPVMPGVGGDALTAHVVEVALDVIDPLAVLR